MQNISFIKKFLTIIMIFGVLVICSLFYTITQMITIQKDYINVAQGTMAASTNLASANRAFVAGEGEITQLLIETKPVEKQKMLEELNKNRELFNDLMTKAAKRDPQNKLNINEAKQRINKIFDQDCSSAIMLGKTSTTTDQNIVAQTEFLEHCYPSVPKIVKDMIEYKKNSQAGAESEMADLALKTRSIIIMSFGIILTGLLITLVISNYAIKKWIVIPLKEQLKSMGEMIGSEYQTTIYHFNRRDEIGQIAKILMKFKEEGLEKINLEREAETNRHTAAIKQKILEDERQITAKKLQLVVEELANGLNKLAKGDLVYRLTTQFGNEYEQIYTDYNITISKLQAHIHSIADGIKTVQTGSDEMTRAADDLARRTEQQAANLEQTAAALGQVTETVKKTAEKTLEASNAVVAAKTDAKRSNNILVETVIAMDEIEKSSKKIGNIITVIDEIAFQTNLLALNAGVEAARAGDAGRGFAVVATEVRALAQRSADAAREIKVLISESNTQVKKGVQLVGKTSISLKDINKQINVLSNNLINIASSTNEQSSGLNEINIAIKQLDQITQQNAAMVEETTAISHGLANESMKLRELVFHFRTNDIVSKINRSSDQKIIDYKKRRDVKITPNKNKMTNSPIITENIKENKLINNIMAPAGENWDEF